MLGWYRRSSVFLCLLSLGGESNLLCCWMLFCFVIRYLDVVGYICLLHWWLRWFHTKLQLHILQPYCAHNLIHIPSFLRGWRSSNFESACMCKAAETSQCFLWTFGLTEPCSCWLLCVIMPTWIALSAWMARGSLYVTCIVSTCVCLLQRFVPAAAVMKMAMQGPVLYYKTACAYLKLIKTKTVKKNCNSCAKKGSLWEEMLPSRKLVWACFDRVLLCLFKNRLVGIGDIL